MSAEEAAPLIRRARGRGAGAERPAERRGGSVRYTAAILAIGMVVWFVAPRSSVPWPTMQTAPAASAREDAAPRTRMPASSEAAQRRAVNLIAAAVPDDSTPVAAAVEDSAIARRRDLDYVGRARHVSMPPADDAPIWTPALRELVSAPLPPRGEVAALALKPARLAARAEYAGCAAGCSGRGHCDQLAGQCVCRRGWSGAACETAAGLRCNEERRTCEGHGAKCTEFTRFLSRCSGRCDAASGRCLCGPRARYPRRHMFLCEWKGARVRWPIVPCSSGVTESALCNRCGGGDAVAITRLGSLPHLAAMAPVVTRQPHTSGARASARRGTPARTVGRRTGRCR